MKSFREFAILLLSSFCCIMVHAQKEYNGVGCKDTKSSPLTQKISVTNYISIISKNA